MSTNHDTITVHVPLTFRKHGGRKQIILPDGKSSWAPQRARIDNVMIKAIARAFRWRNLLETGVHLSVEDIAAAEKINASYVSRVLRLTLLAPDIVEAILDGRQGPEITLAALMKPFPLEWHEQRRRSGRDMRSRRRIASASRLADAFASAGTPVADLAWIEPKRRPAVCESLSQDPPMWPPGPR